MFVEVKEHAGWRMWMKILFNGRKRETPLETTGAKVKIFASTFLIEEKLENAYRW